MINFFPHLWYAVPVVHSRRHSVDADSVDVNQSRYFERKKRKKIGLKFSTLSLHAKKALFSIYASSVTVGPMKYDVITMRDSTTYEVDPKAEVVVGSHD